MTKGESSPKDHRIPPFIRHFLCVHGDHVRIPGLVGHTKPDGGGKGSTLSFKTGKGNRHGPSARTSAFGRFRPANTARRRNYECVAHGFPGGCDGFAARSGEMRGPPDLGLGNILV